jgi:glycosyltransferase involved in cell wall biosynthesis
MIFTLATEYGGTETYVLSLAKLLRESASIKVVIANDILEGKLRDAGVPLTKLAPANGLGKLKQLYQAVRALVAASRRGELNTLLVNGYSEIILIPIARALGHRAFATRHLSFRIEADKWTVMLRRHLALILYQAVAPSANGIIAVSQAVASDLLEHNYFPLRDVTVIPNWVDADSIQKRIPKPNDSGPVRLLYVGRLVQFKGLGTLITALRMIIEKGRSKTAVHLDVIGAGPDESLFKTMAIGLPVTFHGLRKDVGFFYRQADVFINPSMGPEGMPLVTLEAMASGLPCLLSDLPVHSEVAGGGAALMFINDSAESLATQLAALVDSAGLRQDLAERSMERIMERFTEDRARGAYRKALALEG